jgi:NADPH2:quinone reductase
MRAVGVRAFGGAGAIEALDVTKPEPGPNDVLVKLGFSGVNFIDVSMRAGAYANSALNKTALPLVLGMEGAGQVEKAGGSAQALQGARVAYCLSPGSYAEYAVVPDWRVAVVPDGVPLDVAAALQIQGCTAHYLVNDTFPVRKGDVCLVQAAASGVGQLLTQLIKLKGGSVIGTVGSPDKAAIAKARGADHVISYREEDVAAKVMQATGGAGVNVVYDGVGKATMASSLRSLRKRGVLVSYGGTSGAVEPISPAELGEMGSVYFTRPHLADHLSSAAEVRLRTGELFDLYKAGRLSVSIDRVYALADAKQAHEALESRGARGKLLLKIT